MTFYILFILFVFGAVILGYFYPKKNFLIETFIFSLIVFISGFRKNVGVDYGAYINWYQNKSRDKDFEFGYVFIMNIFRKINLDYSFLFFFFSFFTCLFVYLGIKKYTSNTSLALLFFIIIPSLYLASFTLIRQSFAVAISFYAFYYLLNKRYFIYCLLMFAGISIHISCILPFIIFILVFFVADKIKISYLFVLTLLSFILVKFNFISIFNKIFENTRYSYYFSSRQNAVDIWKLITLNAMAVFVLFYFRKLKATNSYQNYFLILYIFSIILLNLLSEYSDLTRLYVYFRIFEILIVSDIIFLEIKKNNFFIFYFYFFLTAITFCIGLTNLEGYLPYNNFLF